MILEDAPSIRAALATMNPMARDATLSLTNAILERPSLLQDIGGIQENAFYACAAAFVASGKSLEDDREKFESFLENNGANVLDLAVSVVLCMSRSAQKRAVWGGVGKAAALVGAVALGAFFG